MMGHNAADLGTVKPTVETGFASFTPEGDLIEINDAMLSDPPNETSAQQSDTQVLDRILITFAEVEGVSTADHAARAKILNRWRTRGTVLNAKGIDGIWRLLSNYSQADGVRCYVSTAMSGRHPAQERAREMLNDAIQSLDLGIALFDDDERLSFLNAKFQQLVGPENERAPIGRSLTSIIADLITLQGGLDPTSDTPSLDRLIADVRREADEITIVTTSGCTLQASARRTRLGGLLLSLQDITEKLRAAQAEREADTVLKKIVEACPTTFLVSRVTDGKIIYCPPASRDRFGKLETTLDFFLKPEDRIRYLEALLPTGSLDDFRVRFKRQDGTVMDGLTSARVTDYKGENVIVSSTRDISQELAMQAELEKQKEIAHQSEKLSALGALLAGVAHELNNPLSIVVGYALMLQEKIHSPKQKRQVERIGQAAERCAKIVKTFLSMARQRPALISTCDPNEIVNTALDIAGYGLRSNGTRTALDLDPALPPITVDADQLAQVLTNLIVNAEHALEELGSDGKFAICTYHDPVSDEVVIEVQDNGKGVPDAIQARIFEPFFTTKDVGSGTGIGLAFCHRVIEAHGGTLTLESAVERGATFIIRLKAASWPDMDGSSRTAPQEDYALRRILVVDDEPGVTEMIRDVLEDNGWSVETRNQPHDVLGLLRTEQFDAILSDIKMPGLTGEEMLEKIRVSSPFHVDRIAFVTGDTMSSKVSEFLAAAGRPYLEKPIAPADLIAVIEEVCFRADRGL